MPGMAPPVRLTWMLPVHLRLHNGKLTGSGG
jgi:hypothetical protein